MTKQRFTFFHPGCKSFRLVLPKSRVEGSAEKHEARYQPPKDSENSKGKAQFCLYRGVFEFCDHIRIVFRNFQAAGPKNGLNNRWSRRRICYSFLSGLPWPRTVVATRTKHVQRVPGVALKRRKFHPDKLPRTAKVQGQYLRPWVSGT